MARISTPHISRIAIATLAIGLCCSLLSPLQAQTKLPVGGGGSPQFSSGPDLHHDVSAPLIGYQAVAPPNRRLHVAVDGIQSNRTAELTSLTHASPELFNGGTGVATTLTAFNIAGVGNFFNGPQGTFTPTTAQSDATGAVGTTQYLQWVDYDFAIFSKATGAIVYGPAAGNTLWSGFGGPCETDNDGEPTVNFDKLAKRWVVSQHAISSGAPYLQCVAVSVTDDATGKWNRYSFMIGQINTSWVNRNAHLGVWSDGYYMSFDMYQNGNYYGPKFCALQRSAMLTSAHAAIQCIQLDSQYISPIVADFDGTTPPPTGAPAYFAADDLNYFALDLWKFHVNWVDPQNSTLSLPVLIYQPNFDNACNSYYSTICALQPNSVALDVHGNHVIGRMPYRNYGDHQSLFAAEAVDIVTDILFYEVRITANGDISEYQVGKYQPDTNHWRFVPSIAADRSGNVAVAYNVSGLSLPASQYVSTRAPGDPGGTLGNETLLNPGNASQTTSTWDGRSTLTVDPVDDCTFYYTQQYQPVNGTNNWSTQIENFYLNTCLIDLKVATSPAGLKASATGTGSSLASQATPFVGHFPVTTGVTVSTTATQAGPAGTRYVFQNWSDGGAISHSLHMPSTPLGLTANFTTQYQFSAAVSPAGAGTVTPSAAAYYNVGSVVNISATPAAGYVFSGWSSGATNSTSSTTTAVIARPMTVTAYFTPLPTTLQTTFYTKSGTLASRLWTFSLKNLGPGQANNISITGFTLNQTAGPACQPPLLSILPLTVKNLAPGIATTVSISLNLSSCSSTARFTATINNVENNGASFSSANIANLAP